jgi:hypothetical protein
MDELRKRNKQMKSEIFSKAIHFRNMIKFLYFLSEITVEPYFISCEKMEKISLWPIPSSNQVKRFEFSAIANIKVLNNKRFSPVIPIKISPKLKEIMMIPEKRKSIDLLVEGVLA